MNNEELEESIQNLIENLNKNKSNVFLSDKKTKKLIQEFDIFREIISNFPDKYEFALTEIISNISFKKYKKGEVILDNTVKVVLETPLC